MNSFRVTVIVFVVAALSPTVRADKARHSVSSDVTREVYPDSNFDALRPQAKLIAVTGGSAAAQTPHVKRGGVCDSIRSQS
jgi:hypothetical protein